jgi:hypothetical protein
MSRLFPRRSRARWSKRGIECSPVDPWYFPTAEEYTWQLHGRGFAVDSLAIFPRPTPLPHGRRAWLELFAESFSSAVGDSDREFFPRDLLASAYPVLES